MTFPITCSIVLYKSDIHVRNAISSFLATPLQCRLFLIDNSPTNELKEFLSNILLDPRVVYIFNNKNIGFGAAHNIAIRKSISQSTYHLVLNPDVIFEPDVLRVLKDYLDINPNVGLVAPKVFYPNGSLQYACKLLPSPVDLIARRFLPAFFLRKRRHTFELRHMAEKREFEAPYIHGCFMLFRTEALDKVGLFDERFFMYPEDIDLTRRMNKAYRTMCFTAVSIIHHHQKGSYKNLQL